MLKWVIPRDFSASPIDFVAVVANMSALEVDEFPDVQDHGIFEGYLSFKLRSSLDNGPRVLVWLRNTLPTG